MDSKVKNAIMFLGIGGLMIIGYVFFVKGSGDKPVLIVAPGDNTAPVKNNEEDISSVARDFLPILLNVKSIKLEDAIFQDEAFKSLKDSSIILVQEGKEGRPNPFAPIGFDSVVPPVITIPSGTSAAPTTAPSNPSVTP